MQYNIITYSIGKDETGSYLSILINLSVRDGERFLTRDISLTYNEVKQVETDKKSLEKILVKYFAEMAYDLTKQWEIVPKFEIQDDTAKKSIKINSAEVVAEEKKIKEKLET